ncbi:MAG: nicotinate (nicotinamide) nucleotide adenylyltransferase [Clostridia bacterium]|nr:nicotinate (nicotinamide) nucleotide adenylyltransferase [Clostridia bacterium]
MRRIGVLGGTFNPVHKAHLQMAALAREQLALERVLLMVAADPPHKPVDGGVDAGTRLEMTRLAAADCAGVEASGLELERPGKSYTVETLRTLKARCPDAALWLIVGSDMLLDLPRWYRTEEIARLADIACVPRVGQESEDREAARRLEERFGARVLLLPAKAAPCSSTQVRERLFLGLPADALVPMPALLYAYERGLYFPPALRALWEKACGALGPKRRRHSAGAAVAAARLAFDWGADCERARLAALMHDCAKELSPRRLSVLSGDDTDIPAVQHAFAGAVLAKTLYGVEDEAVLRAIRRHCTGERGMSLLDKVVYLADAVEPTRDFAGVDALRSALREGPDAAMRLALGLSEARLKAAPVAGGLHPATLRAIEEFQNTEKEERH